VIHATTFLGTWHVGPGSGSTSKTFRSTCAHDERRFASVAPGSARTTDATDERIPYHPITMKPRQPTAPRRDADGFDERKVLVPLGVALGVWTVGTEVFFAISEDRYDVRTGFVPLGLVPTSGALGLGGRSSSRGCEHSRRDRIRGTTALFLHLASGVLLLFFGRPTWVTLGVGARCAIAAVVVARSGTKPAPERPAPSDAR